MSKSQELKKAAAESAAAAAEYGQQALKDSQVVLKEGLERAQVLLEEARKQAGPVIHDYKVKGADFAANKLDELEPAIKDALEKVTPAVDAAREKLEDDLLPKLQEALHTAAEHPAVAEATKRGGAAVLALKGELEPAPKKKSKAKSFAKFLAIAAVVAGAVAAVRHFLAPKDDGWTAHEPSKAYVNNNDTFTTAAKFAADAVPEAEEVAEPAEEESPAEETPADEAVVEEAVVEEAPAEEAAEAPANPYSEGAYMGTEPPEGFTIKGNERSKKYHLEGSGGYERTIAEVWFSSEEAAQAAGFTKAQR